MKIKREEFIDDIMDKLTNEKVDQALKKNRRIKLRAKKQTRGKEKIIKLPDK